MEALFLADAGEAKERGELRYRLAQRFAFFTADSSYSRRELFGFMKKAYDVRSALVHGGTPSADDLKVPKEGKVNQQRFVEISERLFRQALQKAIYQPGKGTALADWDSMILGEK
jgi:hypothetical protein